MAETISVSVNISGAPDKEITLETGRLARQADGAVAVRLGRTLVLVTATAAKWVREGIDFFPLTVDIEERAYAAGKIPGSFFRREGRASDAATLTARLIDRPLRPSFPDSFRNEVHVVGTVMGADLENPHDILAINAASAALMLSGIPFSGPIGAVRIAYTAKGTWIPFPTYDEGDRSSFEMVVAGRELPDGDVAIMMVEAGGTESAWENYQGGAPKLNEDEIARGLEECKPWIRQLCKLQNDLVAEAEPKPPMDYVEQLDYTPEIYRAVVEAAGTRLADTQRIADKISRLAAEADVRDGLLAELLPRFEANRDAEKHLRAAIRSAMKEAVRSRIVNDGLRIDGRGTNDLRPLAAEVGLVPTAHGSGLFERGETQALTIATLGMGRMDQMIDGITPETKKRYMHHYNMPPYSTGETGFMRGPKRREIGHGLLSERALLPVVPKLEEFPYTIRCVSEILSSNGSTSMASVCGSSLALMDAGVPIKAPIAGIAMGLVFAEGRYTTLTDILGAEDAFGDMDFKVAGSSDFVTALQLDTKIDGIPADVLAAALGQAREARLTILGVMADAISGPRSEVRDTAPKIISFQIPVEKIGEIIGPKGKVINAIQAESGADITVDDDGTVGMVSIASPDMTKVNEAERQIRLILEPPTAEVGKVYPGKVVNITKFGAFVNILPGRDGLVHISKMGGGRRINAVEDVLSLGEELEVTVEDIDPQGKISLRPVSPLGGAGGGAGGGDEERAPRAAEGGAETGAAPAGGESAGGRDYVSFEDSFEDELRQEFGELGPAGAGVGSPGGSDRDRGERRGGGSGDRRRRPRRR